MILSLFVEFTIIGNTTDQVIIDGPEPVELQCLLIVVCYVCHLIVSLVTNNVVNEVQFAWWPTKNKQTRDSNLTSLRPIKIFLTVLARGCPSQKVP